MSGRRPFSELRKAMPQEAQDRARAKAEIMLQEMDLAELRAAHKLSQKEMAQSLHVGQAAIAKLEKRTDMYVSTVRRYVEALGGSLDIVARFPGRDVTIKTFEELDRS